MPYNRYDMKRHGYFGRRKKDKRTLKKIMLFVIPVIIVAVIIAGVLISYFAASGDKDKDIIPTQPIQEQNKDEEILMRIVNENRPLEKDFVPKLVPFGGVKVNELLFDDLDDMISDAAASGIKLTVTKGYISYSEQEKLFAKTYKEVSKKNNYSEIKAEAETKKICPSAGCSENQTGLLIELSFDGENKDFAKSEAGKWLEKNAVLYGFVLRYPEGEEESTGMTYSPNMYRYVGKENALNMRRYGMTMEEYSSHIDNR